MINLNTSHVSVQAGLYKLRLTDAKFKYISCVGSSKDNIGAEPAKL